MVNCKAVKEIKPFKIGSSEVLETLYAAKKKKSIGINLIIDWMHFNFKLWLINVSSLYPSGMV